MQGIVSNPHIASGFFIKRQNEMLRTCYGALIKDIWYIYEWQHRGSVHTHCLLWMSDQPDLRPVETLLRIRTGAKFSAHDRDMAEQELGAWSNYYDQYITAVNAAVSDGGASFDNGFDNEFQIKRILSF